MKRKPIFMGIIVIAALLGAALLFTACPTDSDKPTPEPTRYTVSFSVGAGAGTAPGNQTVEAGKSITLPEQGAMTAPTGKTFTGWKYGNQTYQAGASYTVNEDTVFTAQWDNANNPAGKLYEGFYNYPVGWAEQGGLLEIKSAIDQETLLFNGTVEGGNYLGTINPQGSVTLKLPDEKFYTIVAVDKENYEERQEQSARFSVLAYYSNTQPYSVTVSPAGGVYGGSGSWVINNRSSFYVQLKNADQSETYAVLPPTSERFIVPIAMNTPYDYRVYFSKELKYKGKVVGLMETADQSQANIIQATDDIPVYTTTIREPLTVSIKPLAMVINNSDKGIKVYYGTQQKTNGAAGGDLVVTGGAYRLVSGFETGDNTNMIEFQSPAWPQNKKVPVDMVMAVNKVYEITIPANEDASGITVTEADSSVYYGW